MTVTVPRQIDPFSCRRWCPKIITTNMVRDHYVVLSGQESKGSPTPRIGRLSATEWLGLEVFINNHIDTILMVSFCSQANADMLPMFLDTACSYAAFPTSVYQNYFSCTKQEPIILPNYALLSSHYFSQFWCLNFQATPERKERSGSEGT